MDWWKGDIRVYYLDLVEFHFVKYVFVGFFNLD